MIKDNKMRISFIATIVVYTIAAYVAVGYMTVMFRVIEAALSEALR